MDLYLHFNVQVMKSSPQCYWVTLMVEYLVGWVDIDLDVPAILHSYPDDPAKKLSARQCVMNKIIAIQT